MQNLLTYQDVADFLGISTKTVSRKEKAGEIERVGGTGRLVRFRRDDILYLIRKDNRPKLSKNKKRAGEHPPLGVR